MIARFNRFQLRLASVMVCSLLAGSAECAAAPNTLQSAVDATIRPLMAAHDVPGMAVAVVVDGRTRIFNYGVASRETRAAVTDATLFELGSVSKTLTATLVAYAQVQGKLSLDDHPSRFLPQLQGYPIDRRSLRELGTYTAGGLPLQFPDDVTDDASMTAYFQQWKPVAPGGTQREYSNPIIGLLGHVAAAALQQDFAEAMTGTLLPMLGLRHAYMQVPAAAIPDYAWGYNKANKPVRVNPGVFAAEAYGVKANAADVMHFVQANIDSTGLPPALRAAIDATHVGYFTGGDMVQAIAWEQYPYPVSLERLLAGNARATGTQPQMVKRLFSPSVPAAPALYNKTGSTNGFGAYVAFVPAERIGIVLLANRNFPIPARIAAAHAILAALAASTH